MLFSKKHNILQRVSAWVHDRFCAIDRQLQDLELRVDCMLHIFWFVLSLVVVVESSLQPDIMLRQIAKTLEKIAKT